MKKELKIVTCLTLIALVGFLIKAILARNYEFIGYWIVLVILYLLVLSMDKKFNFPLIAPILFSIWSISHMAGGLIKIGKTRLYDLVLIPIIGDPFFILRYDQLIHAFCYFAISILVYFVLKSYMKKRTSAIIAFSILSALGIGLLNEVIEFGMVIFADAADAVGGYYNTALDLVFNLIGAILGSFFARKFLDN